MASLEFDCIQNFFLRASFSLYSTKANMITPADSNASYKLPSYLHYLNS